MISNKHKAFTMAEAILVMTILGIIATIMISTLKPAEFKEKGYKVLAKKVLSNIDTTMTQITINNTSDGTLDKIYEPGSATNTFSANSANATYSNYLGTIFKKYLTSTRTSVPTTCSCNNYANRFYLKDGSCVGITVGPNTAISTWFPGETAAVTSNVTHGVIFFDINGTEDPNLVGQDQFLLPLSSSGIDYEGNGGSGGGSSTACGGLTGASRTICCSPYSTDQAGCTSAGCNFYYPGCS